MPRNRQNHQDKEDGDTVTVKRSAETSRLGVKCCLDEIPEGKRDIR